MDYESVMSLLAFVSLCTFLSCFAVCLGYFFKLHYLVLLRLSLDPSLLQASQLPQPLLMRDVPDH